MSKVPRPVSIRIPRTKPFAGDLQAPGNSDGPLVDASGNVIGISTSGMTFKSMPVNLNFFIPVSGLEAYLPLQLE